VQRTNGARNEERQPDMMYVWEHDAPSESQSATRP
jgi:hypothetical protein